MKYGKDWLYIFFIFLIGVFILFNSSSLERNGIIKSLPNQQNSTKETAKVSRVVDGDTIKVLIQDKEETVRLIGIDSPEVLDERKTIQCFGKEASNKAKEILNDKIILLASDSTQGNRDEYGRLLRYVFLQDGINFNKLMISEGYAREYTFKNNPYKYQSQFIQAEKEAKEENRGLWGSC
jgi:micrococcal nuclease